MVITGTGLLRWLPACQAGDVDLIPGLGRSPGKGNDNPLQYSHLGILWTEEPSGLQSLGSQRHNLATEHARVKPSH